MPKWSVRMMPEQQQNNKGKQLTNQQTPQQNNSYYQQQPMQGQNSGLAFHPEQAQQQQYSQQTQQQLQQQYQQIPEIGQQPTRQPIIQPTTQTPTPKNNGKGIFKLGIGAVAVLLIVTATYFLFFAKPVNGEGNVVIGEFKFCNNIDDYYNCEGNSLATYTAGNDVWFLIKVYGMTQKKTSNGYQIDIAESMTTLDPNYGRVEELTGELQTYNEALQQKKDFIIMKTKLKTQQYYYTGNYLVNVLVHDAQSNKSTSINKEFKLE
jgi:hypothetical protein